MRLFVSALLALSLPLPTAWAADLLDVYRAAQTNDPQFRAAVANYRAVQQRLPQARAGLLPTVGASGDVARESIRVRTDRGIVSRPEGRATVDSTGYLLSLSQPVFDAAALAALGQAKAEVRRAEAEFAAARQDLITRAVAAYLGLLAARDNLGLAEAEKKAIAQQLAEAEARLEVGLVAITDVHDARARFELAEAQLIEAQNLVADRREAVRELTGEAPPALAPLGEVPLVTPEPPDVERWVETAQAQNLALAASREAVEMAREEVQRQRAAHYPTLDLVGSSSRSDSDASITGPGVRSDNEVVGLELNVPIFQGGLVVARIEEAAQRFEAAREELSAARRSVERTTRSAYLGAASGAARVQALGQAVVASESALEARVEGYKAGIDTNRNVLDAQRDLFLARRDLLQARYDYVVNLLRLKQSAGTLAEDDLALVNGWLAP